jgi:hypothetical protein
VTLILKPRRSDRKRSGDPVIRRARPLVLSLGLAGALLVPAFSAHAAWKVLGVIKADKGLDRDEVVLKSGRAFRQVKLKADAADVEIQSLHVVYGNGEVDKIEVRSVLRAGSTTLPRDLKGSERVIRKVILWFKTSDRENKKAIVTIYGND